MAGAAFTVVGGGGGSVSFLDGFVMSYATTGRYCAAVKYGGRKRDIRPIYTAGFDGGGTKDFGFREMKITLDVIYVQSDEDGCLNAFDSDSAIINKVCALAIDDNTYDRVIFVDASSEQPRRTGNAGDTYRMEARFTVNWIR